MEDPNVPQQPQQPQAPQYAPQQPQYQAPQYQAPQYQYQYQIAPRQVNGMGIAGFVLALVGAVFFWCPILDAILSLLAVIFSGFGMRKEPKGLAIAGLVIGLIALVVGVIITIVAITAVDKGIDYINYGRYNF